MSVLTATYSSKDCAFALQHGNYARFRTDMTRNGYALLPRRAAKGPGGGEYRYGHVFEMALDLAIGANRGYRAARSAIWALFREMQGYGLEAINKLSAAERTELLTDYREPFDEQPEHTPLDLAQLVDLPQFFFGDDLISRDAKRPTFMIYDTRLTGDAGRARLIANVTLLQAQSMLVDLKSEFGDARFRESMEEASDDLGVVNLTTIVRRLDDRLALRLMATQIRQR